MAIITNPPGLLHPHPMNSAGNAREAATIGEVAAIYRDDRGMRIDLRCTGCRERIALMIRDIEIEASPIEPVYTHLPAAALWKAYQQAEAEGLRLMELADRLRKQCEELTPPAPAPVLVPYEEADGG